MKRFALLAPVVLLAACKSDGGTYPSLAIRPAERATGTLIPVTPYVPPPTPPAVATSLGQLESAVTSAHAAFQREVPAARSAVNAARGSALGSEAWSVAQVSIAGLESTRSRAMIALADLDRIYAAAATEGGELTRIAATRDTAVAQVGEEDATITGLLGALR
ncbi:MAG: hypothetical protein ABIT09_13440 [Croceibacterium sp.]